MDQTFFFGLLGALLVLAFVANRLVRYTGVPDVIILMITGIVIGPVMHWVNPDLFRGITHGFGSLAVMLILFEGGLDLKLKDIFSHFAEGFFLSLVCFLLSMAAAGLVCRYALHFDWISCWIVGAVIGCSSSAIVLPVLQQVPLRPDVKITLLVEAALGDAFAVLAVSTLLGLSAGGTLSASSIAEGLGLSLVVAIVVGAGLGAAWSRLMSFLADRHFWHVLTFAAVLLIYSGVHAAHGNELVAVLVFGLTLANVPSKHAPVRIDNRSDDWFVQTPIRGESPATGEFFHERMLSFYGELSFLIRTFFFVLLGALVDFGGLRRNAVLALGCFGALFIARWLVVQGGRMAWRNFNAQERELMVWFLPRGLVTAVLGIEVTEVLGDRFAFLPSLAFAIILLTNLVLLIGTVRAKKIAALPADNDPIVAVPTE
jgi:cell volume regulation protein A